MPGVDILLTEQIVSEYAYSWSSFWIAFSVVLGVFIIICVIIAINYDDWTAILCFMLPGLLISILYGFMFGDINKVPIEYKTQYKILISDEVLINDFLSKYEIVDQEGKIYTVIEIE